MHDTKYYLCTRLNYISLCSKFLALLCHFCDQFMFAIILQGTSLRVKDVSFTRSFDTVG